MMSRALAAALLVSTFAVACAEVPDEEEMGSSEEAITGNVAVGTILTTNARLNLRPDASTESTPRITMDKNASVEVLESAPKKGFYHVKYIKNGMEGWAFGQYLDGAPAQAGAGEPPASETPVGGGDDDEEADATPASAFTGRKFSGTTVLFQGDWDFLVKCDSYSRKKGKVTFFCGDAESRSFVDDGAWVAMPGTSMTRKMCNSMARVCKGDKCINARIVEKSVTSSRWEGSQAVMDALGVSAGWKSCSNSFGTATGVTIQLQK